MKKKTEQKLLGVFCLLVSMVFWMASMELEYSEGIFATGILAILGFSLLFSKGVII